MTDVAERIHAGARWLAAAKLVSQVYAWAVTVWVMRLLSPEDYAVVAMAWIVISFVTLFEELGLRDKLIQMPDYTVAHAQKVYGLVIVTSAGLVILIAAAAPAVALFFTEERLIPVLLALTLLLPLSALRVAHDTALQRGLAFRTIAIIATLRAVVISSITLALALAGWKEWALVVGSLAGGVAVTALTIAWSPFRALPSFAFSGLIGTISFGGIIMLQRIVWWGYTRLDALIIGYAYPTRVFGIYTSASQLATLPLEKVGQILNTLSFSGLSRVNEDRERFQHYLAQALHVVAVVMFPAFFGIAAIAYEFTPVVLGPQWEGLGAVVAILALSAPARCVTTITGDALNSLGRPGLNLRCVILTFGFMAAGIFAGLGFGIEGIAAGVVAGSLAAAVQTVWTLAGALGMPVPRLVRELAAPAAAGLAMLIALDLLRPLLPVPFPSWMGLGVTIALGGVIYAGLIAALDREGLKMALRIVGLARFA